MERGTPQHTLGSSLFTLDDDQRYPFSPYIQHRCHDPYRSWGTIDKKVVFPRTTERRKYEGGIRDEGRSPRDG